MARNPTLDGRALAARCAPFQRAYVSSALLQLSGNLIGLLSAYAATGWLLLNGWAALAPLGWGVATVLIARTFLVQHDCGHAAFMPTRRLNDAVGRLVSLFTFTPYGFWREAHNRHHATTGDLDRGYIGDVLTFSVRQFNALSPHDQRRYRRFRNMALTLLVGAPIQFLLRYRTPFFMPFPPARCWRSVLGLDLGLLLLYGGAAWRFGPGVVALSVIPAVAMAASLGGWMFFIQHQFERTYHAHHQDWDHHEAALYGSSFFDMPALLRWCSSNVGLHHIHHLCPSIPNYRLMECLQAVPELANVNRITLRGSLASLSLALWDEDEGRLISFAEAEARGLLR